MKTEPFSRLLELLAKARTGTAAFGITMEPRSQESAKSIFSYSNFRLIYFKIYVIK